MEVESGTLVRWLRAAGEPSRLRLLTLCQHGALSVSDLAHALGQSEPRVSRHLRILCEAGLLQRLPQGQWVHYRLSDTSAPTAFVRGLLAQLDRRDPQLTADRAAARASATEPMDAAQGGESRLGRALAEFFLAHRGSAPLASALVIGANHPELLEAAARSAASCIVRVGSRRAAQACRALAERRGFRCEVEMAAGARPAAASSGGEREFDAVLLDVPLSTTALSDELSAIRSLLTPTGRAWVFEPYESLEGPRGRVVEHPLARLRRLLGEAQLSCERLNPLEAEGEHVLVAVGGRREARPSAAGANGGRA
jgi:DNA-binding transcriptional ArsR family regulator